MYLVGGRPACIPHGLRLQYGAGARPAGEAEGLSLRWRISQALPAHMRTYASPFFLKVSGRCFPLGNCLQLSAMSSWNLSRTIAPANLSIINNCLLRRQTPRMLGRMLWGCLDLTPLGRVQRWQRKKSSGATRKGKKCPISLLFGCFPHSKNVQENPKEAFLGFIFKEKPGISNNFGLVGPLTGHRPLPVFPG